MKTLVLLACLGFYFTATAADIALGRLFYTPAQRTFIDVRKQASGSDAAENPYLHFNGEVRRSSGPDSHWLNGERHPGRASRGLRVGETVDLQRGETQSPLGQGRIFTHRH